MKRKAYLSDLTDKEWGTLKPLIPPAKLGGRPRTANMREVINGIFYVLETGCQWDQLPADFPPKGTVYHYYNTWRKSGVWYEWLAILQQMLPLSRDARTHQAPPFIGQPISIPPQRETFTAQYEQSK